MAFLGGDYQGEESTFEPIPSGEYPMHIVASEMVQNSKSNGRYLKLEMEILEGQQAGRKLTERLNLENPNSKAVEIAQRTLRSIIWAAQLGACKDSEELHFRRMLVKVNVKERDDKPGVMTNEIGGYKQLGSGGASAPRQQHKPDPAPQQEREPAAAAGGGGGAPWKRS